MRWWPHTDLPVQFPPFPLSACGSHAGNGVLLGAGVVCLGPITVGHGSKIGAGSLVVSNLPDYCVAVGVPAKVLRRKEGQDPNKTMDQIEYVFDYII